MKHTITIEPIFKHADGILAVFGFRKEIVVQGDKFNLGLKITNTGEKPTTTFRIEGVSIRSANGVDIFHIFNKEYHVGILNPAEEKIYWISNFGTDMYGLANISLNIIPSDTGVIEAHQISRFNSEELGHFSNSWADFFYIKSSHEHLQLSINNLLLILAAIATGVSIIPLISNFIGTSLQMDMIQYCIEDSKSRSVVYKSTQKPVSCEKYLENFVQ